MGNRITNIGGTSVNAVAVQGSIHQMSISGSVKVSTKVIKELRFADSIACFPDVGLSTVLYVDTGADKLYRWNGTDYEEVSGLSGIIDDSSVSEEKTWSSSKIGDEFSEDRQNIDSIGNISPLTNLEIEAILNA